jgi:dCMP deaminase
MTWDEYFLNICDTIAQKSSCLSRKIGAIAVKDGKFLVATGYNGPAIGYPHCETKDKSGLLTCPRRLAGYKSGQGYDICPAEHAERNVICEAARMGHSLLGTTMYMNCEIPCRECAKSIVNAGIKSIVVKDFIPCPESGLTGLDILTKCGINVWKFKL